MKNIFNLKSIKNQIFILLIFIIFASCTFNRSKNNLISKLDLKNKNIILNNNNIMFLFNNDKKTTELNAYTKNILKNYELKFTPLREKNLNNSFSFFIHYQDKDNYYRLNIFNDTGKIHLYKKSGKKIKNIIYTYIKPFYYNRENNNYKIKVQDNNFLIICNNKVIFSDKLDYYRGKFGIGASGKKGDKVKIILN